MAQRRLAQAGRAVYRLTSGRVAHDRRRAPSGSKNGFVVTDRLLERAVDLDVERRAVLGELERDDRHADHLVELLAPANAGDPPGRDCRRRRPGRPRAGTRPFGHLEADEHPVETALADLLDRPLADEVVLVELDDPRHRRLERIRLRVGVLADQDVHLLEAQDALGLEAERRGVPFLARLEQRVPDVLAERAREVDLVAELADEADAQDERRARRRRGACFASR